MDFLKETVQNSVSFSKRSTKKGATNSPSDHIEYLFDSHHFARAAPMGHSTFPCATYKCQGPYDANFSVKTTGSAGAAWHPGARGHQLRGDSLAFFFLSMLRDALDSLDNVLNTGRDPTLENLKMNDTGCRIPGATNSAAEKLVSPAVFPSSPKPSSESNATALPTTLPSSLTSAARHVRRRLSSSLPISSKSATAKSITNRVNVLFPSQHSLSDVHRLLNLSDIAVDYYVHPTGQHTNAKGSVISSDNPNLAAVRDRIYRSVQRHASSSAHTVPDSSEQSQQQPKSVSVSVLTLVSALVQDYLYRNLRQSPLPPVPDSYHLPETLYPATCYTDYEPRQWRDHSISHHVVSSLHGDGVNKTVAAIPSPSSPSSSAPTGGSSGNLSVASDTVSVSNASTLYTGAVGADGSNSSIRANGDRNYSQRSWLRQLSPFDAKAVARGEAQHLGYLDRKYVFWSQGPGSSLQLEVRVRHISPIWLCELQKGFVQYPSTMADLDLGAEVILDVRHFDNDNKQITEKGNVEIKKISAQRILSKFTNLIVQINFIRYVYS